MEFGHELSGKFSVCVDLTVAPAPGEVNSGTPAAVVPRPPGRSPFRRRVVWRRALARTVTGLELVTLPHDLPHDALSQSRAGAGLARRHGSWPSVVPAPLGSPLGTVVLYGSLFADLRGFTQIAERRLPYDIVFLLNQYVATVG